MNTGTWTEEEHQSFLKGIELYGKKWCEVVKLIPSRTLSQVRTHAQKYFNKLEKDKKKADLYGLSNPDEKNEPMKLRKRHRVDYARLNGTELDSDESSKCEVTKHTRHKARAHHHKLEVIPGNNRPLVCSAQPVTAMLAYPISNDITLLAHHVPYAPHETDSVVMTIPSTVVIPAKPLVSGYRTPPFPVPLMSSVPPQLVYPVPVAQCPVIPSVTSSFTPSFKQSLP